MKLTTRLKEEGRQEGQARSILRLCKRRWRFVNPVLEGQVRSRPSRQPEHLAEALLDFQTVTDWEHWLSSH